MRRLLFALVLAAVAIAPAAARDNRTYGSRTSPAATAASARPARSAVTRGPLRRGASLVSATPAVGSSATPPARRAFRQDTSMPRYRQGDRRLPGLRRGPHRAVEAGRHGSRHEYAVADYPGEGQGQNRMPHHLVDPAVFPLPREGRRARKSDLFAMCVSIVVTFVATPFSPSARLPKILLRARPPRRHS